MLLLILWDTLEPVLTPWGPEGLPIDPLDSKPSRIIPVKFLVFVSSILDYYESYYF